MKRLILILLLSPILSFSQNEVDTYFSTIEDTYIDEYLPYNYLLADSVILRSCPSKTCNNEDLLLIGQKFKILERSYNVDTIRTIKSHWYKIELSNMKTGWIWGGFIAQRAFGSESDPSLKFVMGISRYIDQDGWLRKKYQIRAFKNHKEIDRYEVFIHSQYFDALAIGNKGLAVADIIRIDIPCEGGCGCSGGYIYVFWNGIEFTSTSFAMGIADAWASEDTSLIFPTDMEGIANTVIRESNTIIDDNFSNDQYKRSIKREYLYWNGRELTLDESKEIEEKVLVLDIE